MPPRRRRRLDPALFALPVDALRAGAFSDPAAIAARGSMPVAGGGPRVRMEIVSERPGFLGGIDEAIAILRLASESWGDLDVHALFEGDRVDPWEPVLTIAGPFVAFAHLETPCVGVLSRRTGVATMARALFEAARPKRVQVEAGGREHWVAQPGDGYAAVVGGVKLLGTPAMASWAGEVAAPLVTDSFIAACGGDAAAAALQLAEHLGSEVPIAASVSYHNDCVGTALELARALGGRLAAVRIDTPHNMVDRSVIERMGAFPPAGVNPELVWSVRNALDAEGFGDVQIIVAGDFDVARIRAFEEEGVPADVYAVEAALLAHSFRFRADIVEREGTAESRAGRSARGNPRLERVK